MEKRTYGNKRERAGLEALNERVRNGEWPRISEMTWEEGLPEKVKQTAKELLGDAIEVAIAKYVKQGNKRELYEIELGHNLPYASRLHAHDELQKLGGYDFLKDGFAPKLLELVNILVDNEISFKKRKTPRNGFEFADPPKEKRIPKKLLN